MLVIGHTTYKLVVTTTITMVPESRFSFDQIKAKLKNLTRVFVIFAKRQIGKCSVRHSKKARRAT